MHFRKGLGLSLLCETECTCVIETSNDKTVIKVISRPIQKLYTFHTFSVDCKGEIQWNLHMIKCVKQSCEEFMQNSLKCN